MNRLKQPATVALLNQVIGLAVTAAAILIGNMVFSTPSTVLTLVLGTGTVAALISWKGKQPWWWIPIHMIFPLALLCASVLQIPAIWYFMGFVICVTLFGTIHKTRVPYYPSRKPVWDALSEEMSTFTGPLQLIDIGCGMGGCALHLQKTHPTWKISGIELALLPWLVCRVRSLGRENPDWHYGDYQSIDMSEYGIIFAYLSPAAMPALEQKLTCELQPGAIFASLEFRLPTWKIHNEIETVAGTLYLYRP